MTEFTKIIRDNELKALKYEGKIFIDKQTSLDRRRIGEETAQLLRDGKIKKYIARIHDIDLEKQETEEE